MTRFILILTMLLASGCGRRVAFGGTIDAATGCSLAIDGRTFSVDSAGVRRFHDVSRPGPTIVCTGPAIGAPEFSVLVSIVPHREGLAGERYEVVRDGAFRSTIPGTAVVILGYEEESFRNRTAGGRSGWVDVAVADGVQLTRITFEGVARQMLFPH